MKRLLARLAAGAFRSNEDVAERMFTNGYLAAGGSPSDLSANVIDDGVFAVLFAAEEQSPTYSRRDFIMDQAEIFGRNFAQVTLNGEEWATSHNMGWHAGVLKRHQIALKQ